MFYDYYCTNCGHKNHGEEVVFNLAQMLDINPKEGDSGIFIEFTQKDLKDLADRQKLPCRGRIQLEITLKDLLLYLSRNLETEADKKALKALTYSDFIQTEKVANLLHSSRQSEEVTAETSRSLLDAIHSKLMIHQPPEKTSDTKEWEDDTDHYYMLCWMEPVYFPDTEEIYTIHYSWEEKPVNLRTFEYVTEIRGYCPKCRKPVLSGAGLYEHFLVGFLGAQSAGKTTLFVAMINELPNMFLDLGIKLPSPLYLSDGEKYLKLKEAIEFYSHGWSVKKTDADTAETEAYNASLMIESDHRKILLTFVDISGELCYDITKNVVNQEAFQKFPLITSCHLYLLCTCVSQKGYGDAEGKISNIPNTALLEISGEIYRKLDRSKGIPPMCLVITKVDMGKPNAGEERKNMDKKNPFDHPDMPKIPRAISAKMKKNRFDPYEQLLTLRTLYEETGNDDIRAALEWCCNAYINSRRMTYLSIASCSALGMQGRMYKEDSGEDYEHDGDKFQPSRLEDVWTWILCSLGVIPVKNGYCFSHIPSYGEAYRMEHNRNIYNVRTCYSISEEQRRTAGIYQLYLNPSSLDRELHKYAVDDPGLLKRMLSVLQNPQEEIVRKYLSTQKKSD